MTHAVTIPEIGESITEALILRWIKKPGEHVGRDEPLVELETDKVTVEMPSPVAGVVAELVVAEGETVAIGAVIARIEEGAVAGAESAVAAAASTTGAAAAGAATAPPATEAPKAAPPAPPASSTSAEPRRIMPAAQRLIAEHGLDASLIPATGKGGGLLKNDVTAYIEKREAESRQPESQESPSADDPRPEAGPPSPGAAMPAGTSPAPPSANPQPVSGAPSPTVAAATATSPVPPSASPQPVSVTPSATGVPPAGPSPAPAPSPPLPSPTPAAAPASAPAAARAEERVAMSPIRRRIAERLVQSQQQAALLTTFNEIDMSAVKAFRTQYRDAFEKRHGVRLGFLSFFVKAAVDALGAFPRLNAEISGTDIVYRNYYDVGIAVSTDRGLMVPVLRNAEGLSFAEIESRIADFAGRARTGRIRIDELQGGTFTITNGGIFGSLLSTPIINPPQSGVLGLHAIQDRPVVEDGEIVVRPMMYVALTYDHRIVDGREAVSFLVRIKEAIQDPARMLIEV